MSPKANALEFDKYVSILMKASNGFGKTIAAATFALQGPTYIAYFDKSKPIELKAFFTEARFGARAKKILDNIEYDVYGAHNCHDYLNKMFKLADRCPYTTLITDSATNLTASAVNWSLGFRDTKNAGKRDPQNKNAPAIIPDFDEYKVETSLISQALDIQKSLTCNNIWLAHPLPSIKIEGSGASIRVTKTNPITTYGSKVAGMIPGNFTEIYHLSQDNVWDKQTGKSSKRYIVNLDAQGDEFAKSPLLGDYIKELDITDKLFYEVWKEALDKYRLDKPVTNNSEANKEAIDPFAGQNKIDPNDKWADLRGK